MPDPNYPTSLLQLLGYGMPSGSQSPQAGRPGVGPYPSAPQWWNLPGMGPQQGAQRQPPPQQATAAGPPQQPPGQPADAYGQPNAQRTIYNDPRMRQQMGQFGLNLLGPQRYL